MAQPSSSIASTLLPLSSGCGAVTASAVLPPTSCSLIRCATLLSSPPPPPPSAFPHAFPSFHFCYSRSASPTDALLTFSALSSFSLLCGNEDRLVSSSSSSPTCPPRAVQRGRQETSRAPSGPKSKLCSEDHRGRETRRA